jgi:hypothetical protein
VEAEPWDCSEDSDVESEPWEEDDPVQVESESDESGGSATTNPPSELVRQQRV